MALAMPLPLPMTMMTVAMPMGDSGHTAADLPESLLQLILKKCEFQDVLRASAVHRRWLSVASDETLWMHFCRKDFALCSPSDHLGSPCSSFQEAYKSWHTNFSKYPAALVLRTKHCWDTLRSWTSSNFPEVARSLREGVSEEYLDKLEVRLGWKLPLAVRLLYRFCDGQEIRDPLLYDDDDVSDDEDKDNTYSGLFGGYEFYDHNVNVQLLSLEKALFYTQHIVPQLRKLKKTNWLIVAASPPLNKLFFLDCSDGVLYVGTRNLASQGELIDCVPSHLYSTDMQDSILCWLEEYSRRLSCGIYKVQKYNGDTRISLFPEKEPFCTEAVTHGVQVRSSAVFVPEQSTFLMDRNSNKFMFAYQIQMRLLASGSGLYAHSFNRCQLCERHWVILENAVVKDEVHGAAVIGLYPLLETEGKAFMYASCSLLNNKGSMRGHFTFVPGSLAHPDGSKFIVEVAEFPMEHPEFIF